MKNKIIVFGGNINSLRYLELKEAAKKLRITLDVVSYKELHYKTENKEVYIGGKNVNNYDLCFFRNTKKYWEEVSLILDCLDGDKIIVDPVVKDARPSDVCKAYQMLVLSQAGLSVPRSVYGDLDFLEKQAIEGFSFPLIIKGSRGDGRRQVFKIYGKKDFREKIEELKLVQKKGENKYMLQEYINNTEDFRVLVIGDKVIGIMRRSAGENPRLKNVFEKFDLPKEVQKLAIKAADVCGISIAGVDVVFRDGDFKKPLFFEVNKTPSYSRFVETTGIDVAKEIVKFLAKVK